MRVTNACDTKLSAEHLISEGVLKVLAEKQVEVSGTPWLKGQKKVLGFAALTANCLCTRHNSLLSPIDTVGAKFFEAIQTCGTTVARPGLRFLLSGHDVERWMLRSLAIFGVSKNFAIDGAVIDQDIVDRLRIVEFLEDPALWQTPAGFYRLRGFALVRTGQTSSTLREAAFLRLFKARRPAFARCRAPGYCVFRGIRASGRRSIGPCASEGRYFNVENQVSTSLRT
jgi:hypothetical protein